MRLWGLGDMALGQKKVEYKGFQKGFIRPEINRVSIRLYKV